MLVVAYGVLLVRYDRRARTAGGGLRRPRYSRAEIRLRGSHQRGRRAPGRARKAVHHGLHHHSHDRVDQGKRRGADRLPAFRQPRGRGHKQAAAAWPVHRRAWRRPDPAGRAEHSGAALDRRVPGPGGDAQHWPAHRHAGADPFDEPAGHQPDAAGLAAPGDDRRPQPAQGHRELPGAGGARWGRGPPRSAGGAPADRRPDLWLQPAGEAVDRRAEISICRPAAGWRWSAGPAAASRR